MGKLNKESSVPLYQQLMEVIQNQILNGELKENDRIPTEIELSREYDVSRITVRKAVELLVEEEILIKRQGIGTFVSQKSSAAILMVLWDLLKAVWLKEMWLARSLSRRNWQRLLWWMLKN